MNYNVKYLMKILGLLRDYKLTFLVSILIYVFIQAIGIPIHTYAVKNIINATYLSDYRSFTIGIILVCSNVLIQLVGEPISIYYMNKTYKSAFYSLKSRYIEHILHLPCNKTQAIGKGELLSNISNDIECINSILSQSLLNTVNSFVIGVVGIITLLKVNFVFGILVLSLGGATILVNSRYAKHMERQGQRTLQQLEVTNTIFYKILKQFKNIRLLRMKQRLLLDFTNTVERECENFVNTSKLNAKNVAINSMISQISYFSIFISGCILVYFNMADWGEIVTCIGLKYSADCLFVEAFSNLARLQKDMVGAKKVFEIFEFEEDKISDEHYEQNKLDGNKILQMQNICFSYEGSQVLKNFNLTVHRNELVMILGHSGSGKSTVLKLILGLIWPENGKIIFSTSKEFSSIREISSYVSQESFIFHGTIYENLTMGLNISMDKVIECAKLAGIHEFINGLDDKYSTVISDDGNCFSGGQRQRICIARALIKGSEVILLDEVTSALDKANEEKIVQTILKIKEGRGVLFITHNRELAKYADRIIQLKAI